MSNREIYILTHSYPQVGGEVYLQDEIEAIANEGYNIQFCPYAVLSEQKGVLTTQFIPKRKDNLQAISYVLGDFFVAPLGLTIVKFRYLVALVKERIAAARFYAQTFSPNAIVYSYWFDELAVLAQFIKQNRPDITWVSRAHGFDVYEEQSDDEFLFFKQNKLSAIDKLFVVSKNGALYLKNQHPRYVHKIHTAYLGCKPLGKSKINTEDTLQLVTCAFVRSIKRIDLLLDALPLLGTKHIVLKVIGDGPDLDLLKAKAEKLPAHITCVFYGRCSKAQIEEIYNGKLDCFVNVSSSEGLPVSIMEAISAAIPVVATAVGGTPEIVNETTGMCIDPNFTLQELANAIEMIAAKSKDSVYRNEIFNFWNANFNSLKNYRAFYEELNA